MGDVGWKCSGGIRMLSYGIEKGNEDGGSLRRSRRTHSEKTQSKRMHSSGRQRERHW